MKDQKNKKKSFHKTLTIHYNMFIKKEIALIILERKKQRKQDLIQCEKMTHLQKAVLITAKM
jgi:hypothetical protein